MIEKNPAAFHRQASAELRLPFRFTALCDSNGPWSKQGEVGAETILTSSPNLAPGTDQATAAALRRRNDHDDRFPEQIGELVGFLEENFPEGHPYRAVHAVPGPWQAEQNRVPHTEGLPELWALGSSTYSAHLAARLGRPYAFALQFAPADVTSALRIYRHTFRPSPALAEPRVMVSVSVAAHDDPEEARRQTSSAAMAMLRMFQRKPYALLAPDEVAAHPATLDERQVLNMYMANTLHGTSSEVGVALERLHEQTSADEIMLVTGGHSREIQTRTVELVADHSGLPAEVSVGASQTSAQPAETFEVAV